MKSLHCLPFQTHSMDELEHRLKEEASQADVLEIWLDGIADLRLAEIFFETEKLKKPFLFVNKAPCEGGDFLGTPEERVETLIETFRRGAAYVDVALSTPTPLIRRLVKAKPSEARLILSYHNFKETPPLATLRSLLRAARRKGADLVKVATFVHHTEENVTLFELTRWALGEKIPIITVGMGEAGKLSRIVCPLLGSALYYASLRRDQSTAPGQLTKAELETAWAVLK